MERGREARALFDLGERRADRSAPHVALGHGELAHLGDVEVSAAGLARERCDVSAVFAELADDGAALLRDVEDGFADSALPGHARESDDEVAAALLTDPAERRGDAARHGPVRDEVVEAKRRHRPRVASRQSAGFSLDAEVFVGRGSKSAVPVSSRRPGTGSIRVTRYVRVFTSI